MTNLQGRAHLIGQSPTDVPADSGEVGRAFRMMSATRFRSKPAIDCDRCRPGGERPAGRLSFGISVSAMVGSPMMLCQRSTGIWRSRRGGLLRHWRRNGPRGAVIARLAARAAARIMETQALFDRPVLLM